MVNLKTIYFNMKYFPMRQALRLPIFISRHVLLKSLKGTVMIEGPIRTAMIKIGYGEVALFDRKKSRTILELKGTAVFRGTASIGHGSKISVSDDAKVSFGNNFIVSAESSIVAHREIGFGDNCLLSWDILIMDTDLHHIYDKEGKVLNEPQRVLIESNVWIGCRSTILKGSMIPKGTVIAAGSLISKVLVTENCIYGGNPCRILKEEIYWKP